jgi:pyruvate,water dikinase
MATPLPYNSSTFWLDAAPDLPALGGKARLLARLVAAGLPVPPGFVLPATALPTDRPPGMEVLWLPAEAAAALTDGYTELGRRLGVADPLVAVRSSGLAEDLEQASFAGQYATVLGVRSEAAVLSAAVRCWTSLWTPKVAAHCPRPVWPYWCRRLFQPRRRALPKP